MHFKRSTYLLLLFLGFALQEGYSQFSQIGGVINEYVKVESIFLKVKNDVDSLIVENLDGSWEVDDTVMVYCVKGASPRMSAPNEENIGDYDALEPTNAGKYAFFLIQEIDVPSRLIVLNSSFNPSTDPMTHWDPIGDGETVQLIKVPSYRRAEVSSTLTAKPWDPVTGTGGVLALFVQRTLRLTDSIDVSGIGFRGAMENVPYPGVCSASDTVLYDSMFYRDDRVLAGRKGESITRTDFEYTRGKARAINGGGGGNGRMSGGGGGSNFSTGGAGGFESSSCDPGVDAWGRGGFNLGVYFYKNGNPLNRGDRIFLGGGGGTGTEAGGRYSTAGGHGGGLVVIVADSIEGNNRIIRADGNSVEDTADGAGGGGGGGGGILLDVNEYNTTLELRAVGGDGGDTYYPTDTTGPGGGGGGGFYWISGPKPAQVNTEQLITGEGGKHLSTSPISYGADKGGPSGLITGLVVPLRGFLFNTVPDQYWICSDQVPDTIYASTPKGGTGSYEYTWIDSTSEHGWQEATYGTYKAKDFAFSAPLTDTTWYRRVVESGTALDPDTSFRIAVYVHAAITGNTITAPDTVCYDNAPEIFMPDGVLDFGDPTQDPRFTYQWLSRTESSSFSPVGHTDSSYQAGNLTETTYFAREVSSGACVDTSNSLLVKVWPSLTNNLITASDLTSAGDTICYDSIPGQLNGLLPENGDPSDYRYIWQDSAAAGIWTDIPGADERHFQPSNLTETTYFRRIVLSGSDDACVDISDFVEILNIPLITGNTIADDQTVCTNAAPLPLTGAVPGGGQEGEYAYRWESRTLSNSWATVSGSDGVNTDFEPGTMSGDTTWFRRVVGSGGAERNVCIDYSDSVVINVLPSITGNQLTTADAVKCQWDSVEFILQDPAAGTEPGGGATQGGVDPTRRYQWESALGTGEPDPGSWELITGEDQLNYTARPQLEGEEDYFIRRIVFSGPAEQCSDTATMQITVHTRISGNSIDPADSVCFADTKELPGNSPSGETGLTPVYTWVDLDAGTDIPGSDQKDLTYGPYNQLGQYHYLRRVAIGECTDTSNSMEVTVMQLPGGRLTDDPFRACEQDTSFAIDLNMDQLTAYALPWNVTLRNQVSTGIGPIPISSDGQLPVTLDIDSDSLELNYEIESISYSWESGYECVSPVDSLEGVVPVYVFRKPDPTATALENPICNTTMTITVDSDNGIGSWSSDPPGGILFTPGAQENTFLATIPNDHEAFGSYQMIFRSEAGDCFDTAIVNARFDEQPDPPMPGPTPTTVFVTDQYIMQADSASAGIGTWEVISGGATVVDENDPHTTVYGLSEAEENYFRWTVENGACGAADSVMVIFRNDVKRYNGFSPNGDLQNEYFIMQGLPYADIFEISFFNALGNIVRTITNETVDELEVDESLIDGGLKEDEMVVWDGRSSNGNLVPSGTYYFVLKVIRHQRDYETGAITVEDPGSTYKDYVVVERE